MKTVLKIMLVGAILFQTGTIVSAQISNNLSGDTYIECGGHCGGCPNAGGCPNLPAPAPSDDTDTDSDAKPSDCDSNCQK